MFDLDTLNGLFGDAVTVADGRVTVNHPDAIAGQPMDQLVRAAVFAEGVEREYARWLIWEIGQAVGVQPASIHDLYMARGRGEIGGFTVPAINVRVVTYDTARVDLPHRQSIECRRVHPRDRAVRDRVHRSAARTSTSR